jgi:hypothetical protein
MLHIPWGNCGSGATRSSAGADVVSSRGGAPRRAATHAARRRSARTWRECWPERRRRRGVEGPAAHGGAGAGTPTVGVAGAGPGPCRAYSPGTHARKEEE